MRCLVDVMAKYQQDLLETSESALGKYIFEVLDL